jgi:DNA-binding transcriptional regulator YdaS (Cro superfamily)
MDALLSYINGLPDGERVSFASRCQTTLAYLRKACSINQKLSEILCLRIGIESNGCVPPEKLRPDVDWDYMRAALASQASSSAGATGQGAR